MQSAFETMIWVVCGLGVVIGLVAVLRGGKVWDDYGQGGLMMEHDIRRAPKRGSLASTAERDEEIRQLLEARNARRMRRGEAPLDIEQELGRLTVPRVDDELRAEIRDLVMARNHRRARQGKPLLDVQAEIEREIRELPAM